MRKIVVFGKPGGGKSTLSKQLSAATGIDLYPLDQIEYEKNGERVAATVYAEKHSQLIKTENWIIDGLGTMPSFWQRVEAADTLIYVDLPYANHYWWVTKRLLKSPFVKPEGWPEGCSVLKGSLASFKYLRLSPKFWTSELFDKIKQRTQDKRVYRINSVKELNEFASKFVS